VKIKNVRGFREVDLDFSRPDGSLAGWTVLAGRNGAGKSTLLKAIALSLAGPPEAKALVPSFANWVSLGGDIAETELLVEPTEEDTDYLTTSSTIALRWASTPNGAEPRLTGVMGHEFAELERDHHEGPWSGDPFGWFIAGYGPYRRLTGHASEAQRLMAGPRRVAGLVTLFREDASLVESVSWLREIYLRRLEKKLGADHLEKTVLSLLNDGLLPDDVIVENIDSEGLWVRQRGIRLPLTELSDGYRTTAALIMDIVRQLDRHADLLDINTIVEASGTCQQIGYSGVVLIDEVDLHLHVSWQKGIGFWLKRHFPNIQFIVTTHSPFVCQAADPRGLIRLPAPGENRSAEHVSEALYNTVVNGGADDAVLTELFGLDTPYSGESERLRERVAQLEALLQSGKVSDKEREELKELRSRLPQTLSADMEQALRTLAINE